MPQSSELDWNTDILRIFFMKNKINDVNDINNVIPSQLY